MKKLDKINLMNYKTSSDSGEKIMFLTTILDAANNYLFFGLAKNNGCSAPEFWYAFEYFYRIRASDPSTWGDCRSMKVTSIDEVTKKRKTKTTELTDNQIKGMCFDMHFSLSGIKTNLKTFLKNLKHQRTQIIEEHWDQINTHLMALQALNHDIITLDIPTRKRILINPESPEEVAMLIQFRAAEDKKTQGIGINDKCVENAGDCIFSSNI